VRKLRAKPLTARAFSSFGEVIEIDDAVTHYPINRGFTERYHDLATLDLTLEKGRPIVNLFRATPLPQPFSITMMERHPLSSQTFMPLGHEPYLVVVAPAGEFSIDQLHAFIANCDQGVNYRRGTWHHFCLALNTISDFLVIDRGGEGENCDEVDLSGQQIIATWPDSTDE